MFGDPALFRNSWPEAPYHLLDTTSKIELLTSADIDLLLQRGIQTPSYRMVKDGHPLPLESISRSPRATSVALKGLVDPVRVSQELQNGATLILQGLNRIWLPLNEVCRQLSRDIGHPVFVNSYLTPAASCGFYAHHDPYHAWLVQVEGQKAWQLWGPRQNPAADRPDLELTLNEGDVLWIPRGWLHAGVAQHQPSLHLTFTVWATRLEDVLRAVVAEILSCQETARELPPNALSRDSSATEAVRDALAEIARSVAGASIDEVAAHVLSDHVKRFDPLPARTITDALGRDQQTRYHVHQEGILYQEEDSAGIYLRTADSVVTVRPEEIASCTALLSRKDTFLAPSGADLVDPELLQQLLTARLVCASPCGSKLAPTGPALATAYVSLGRLSGAHHGRFQKGESSVAP